MAQASQKKGGLSWWAWVALVLLIIIVIVLIVLRWVA